MSTSLVSQGDLNKKLERTIKSDTGIWEVSLQDNSGFENDFRPRLPIVVASCHRALRHESEMSGTEDSP